MSVPLGGFNDPSKWVDIIIGTGVISNKTATQFQAGVTARNDWAELRATAKTTVTAGIDISVKVNRTCYASGLTIHANSQGGDGQGYAIERNATYGIVVWHGSGAPYTGADPLPASTPEELRITVQGTAIRYYVNGVLVYTGTLLGWVSTSLYVGMYANPNTAAGGAVAGTVTFTSTATPPPAPPTITISPIAASAQVGQVVLLNSTVSGGTSPYTVRWYDSANTLLGTGVSLSVTPIAAGTILIHAIVTDATGLQATSNTSTITVTTPTPSEFTVTIDSIPIRGVSVTVERVS